MHAGTAIMVLLSIHVLGLPGLMVFLFAYLWGKGMPVAGILAVSSFTALFFGVLLTLIFTSMSYGGSEGAVLLYICFLVWIVLAVTGIGATIAVLWKRFKRSGHRLR